MIIIRSMAFPSSVKFTTEVRAALFLIALACLHRYTSRRLDNFNKLLSTHKSIKDGTGVLNTKVPQFSVKFTIFGFVRRYATTRSDLPIR